ncbi:ABC transporter substrate-binding protein [Phreatobacter stygius]|uniref:Iron complex transporter substrate-binding protein n=1 Tax=Phreatobacter stygius TaxID=1940610 RepID=A0A4D7BBY6_9HYPH|nr:ABC transporter substrate-binding protein [Phreatobacter stygius]QCI68280.1 iron complex transporter substrate-binding protein [Phreatobacter stygius]
MRFGPVFALAMALGFAPGAARAFPVEVDNCFETARFDAAPRRAVVNDTNMVQTMLDLGLADRIVAVSGIAGVERHLIAAPGVVAALHQFVGRYPSLEAVLGQDPDFMFAGWNYGFSAARGLTPAALAEMGVKSYTLRESCIRVGRREPITMETLYTDLQALGAIFGIVERAERMVTTLRRRVADVVERVRGAGVPPRVMYCSDCNSESPPVSVGAEGMTALITRLAGGRNIFDDVADSYVRVSWEEVARRDPQWILISDHRVPISEIIRHLTSDPQLGHVEAIRKRQFIIITYAEQTPSTRSVDGLEKIARALHPDRFAP